MSHATDELLQRLTLELARLPGVGRRNARRMALDMVLTGDNYFARLIEAIQDARTAIHACPVCGNLAAGDRCDICRAHNRNQELLCAVEGVNDLWAIEESGTFKGLYHVLGGVLSPLDGIGPNDLRFQSLLQRVQQGTLKEIIVATNPTVEGDATAYYLARLVSDYNVTVSRIAVGLPKGADIEYADRHTIENALNSRRRLSIDEV